MFVASINVGRSLAADPVDVELGFWETRPEIRLFQQSWCGDTLGKELGCGDAWSSTISIYLEQQVGVWL